MMLDMVTRDTTLYLVGYGILTVLWQPWLTTTTNHADTLETWGRCDGYIIRICRQYFGILLPMKSKKI